LVKRRKFEVGLKVVANLSAMGNGTTDSLSFRELGWDSVPKASDSAFYNAPMRWTDI
jgi:hypothetical protein